MKIENDKAVMKKLYIKYLESNQDSTIPEMSKVTGISKSSLKTLFDRFKKNGWIERRIVYGSKTNVIKYPGEADKQYWIDRSEIKGNYKKRRSGIISLTRKVIIPKKRIEYHLLRVPYFIGDIKGKTVSKGYKREWRALAKELKTEYKVKKVDKYLSKLR